MCAQILRILCAKVFVRSVLIEHIQLHSRLFPFLSQQGTDKITREPFPVRREGERTKRRGAGHRRRDDRNRGSAEMYSRKRAQ